MGTLKVFDGETVTAKVSLGLENSLLRGARLKDTEFIHGTDFKVLLAEDANFFYFW